MRPPTWTWPSEIVINSKCQRMGVCNAAESLLVHADVAGEFLPAIGQALAEHGVEIRGDERTCELVPQAKPATRRGLRHRVSGADHFVARRRLARRGDRAHQSLRLEAHRRDRDRRPRRRRASLPPASTARP